MIARHGQVHRRIRQRARSHDPRLGWIGDIHHVQPLGFLHVALDQVRVFPLNRKAQEWVIAAVGDMAHSLQPDEFRLCLRSGRGRTRLRDRLFPEPAKLFGTVWALEHYVLLAFVTGPAFAGFRPR